jgi:hypothetical protein
MSYIYIYLYMHVYNCSYDSSVVHRHEHGICCMCVCVCEELVEVYTWYATVFLFVNLKFLILMKFQWVLGVTRHQESGYFGTFSMSA